MLKTKSDSVIRFKFQAIDFIPVWFNNQSNCAPNTHSKFVNIVSR